MKTKSTKNTSLPLVLAVSCAALLTSGGIAAATDYTAQSLTVGNGAAITVMQPAERQTTLAIFPGRRVWSPQQASGRSPENAVQHAPSGNGNQVTFLAPNR